MAKQLLLNVLGDTLGNYIEGFGQENLKLGVWSGKVELFNLKLRDGVLDNLNLPIAVSHGYLKSLTLKIPWTALESKPVQVFIDGLYLQAGPIDLSKLSPELLKQQALVLRREKLQSAQDQVFYSGHSESSESKAEKASYLQQLTAKIIDNLEVVISNVHIRYEDKFTIPGKVLSAGITLSSISLATTDALWNEMFVSRSQDASTIHKLGKVVNLGIYWNPDGKEFLALTPEKWEEAMISYITQAQQLSVVRLHETNELSYLLPVPNELVVKVIHSDVASEITPKIDLLMSSSTLSLNIDKEQYSQVMATLAMFGQLSKHKQMASKRPPGRPTDNPRGWWKYAYMLVSGRDLKSSSQVMTYLCVFFSHLHLVDCNCRSLLCTE